MGQLRALPVPTSANTSRSSRRRLVLRRSFLFGRHRRSRSVRRRLQLLLLGVSKSTGVAKRLGAERTL